MSYSLCVVCLALLKLVVCSVMSFVGYDYKKERQVDPNLDFEDDSSGS